MLAPPPTLWREVERPEAPIAVGAEPNFFAVLRFRWRWE